MTTSPMTWLACLEWMLARGYDELMWPLMQIEGTIDPTQTESLAKALQRSDDRSTRGRRYFIDEAPSRKGDICAWVYELPADLDPGDPVGERRAIDELLDGPQFVEDYASDSVYYAYRAGGVTRASREACTLAWSDPDPAVLQRVLNLLATTKPNPADSRTPATGRHEPSHSRDEARGDVADPSLQKPVA